jgi:PAS domain S-box-containing protein
LRVAERTAELSDSNCLLRDEIEERKHTQERLALMDFALNQVGEAAYLLDENAMFHYVNDEACRALGYDRDTLLNMGVFDIDPDWPKTALVDFWSELKRQGTVTLETRHRTRDGRVFPVEVNASFFSYQGVDYDLALVRDISDRKRQEAQEENRRQIFEALAQGGELSDILNLVVAYVEQADPECIGSIMLLDADGTHLQALASPHLPADFMAAVDGITVANGAGSCGTAVSRGETVIAGDVRTHPYWAPYRDLALRFGLLACWSEPIFDSAGKVLGTFGIYHRRAQEPNPADLELLRRASHIAAIAIERRQIEAQLLVSERKFRSLAENSPDNIGRYDTNGRYLYCNSKLQELIGLPIEAILGKTPVELNDIKIVRDYQAKIDYVVRARLPTDFLVVSPPSRPGMRKIHDHVSFVPEFDDNGQLVSVLAIGRDISPIKDVERQFRALVENIPDFVVRLDTQGRHLYVSPNVLKAFSVAEEFFLGKTTVEIGVTGDAGDDQILLDAALSCAREGVANQIELAFQGNGFYRINSIVHVPEFDEFGQVATVLGVARDITERYRLEQELTRRETEYRTLAENSPDVIVRYDLEGRRIYFNRSYLEIAAMDAATAQEKAPLESWRMASPAAEEYTERLRRVMASGEADELLLETTGSDGLPRYYTISMVPEFDDNKRIVSVLTIGHDITGIKRMEAMLRKSELEFRTLAENSPEMIVRYDRNCRRIYMNPAYERQTGIPLEVAWNKTPAEICKPLTSCEDYMDRLNRVMANGEPDRILLEWYGPDGNLTSHDMHAVAEYDDSGQVIGVLVMGHNITELKATERRLEESRAQLRTLTAKREEAREEERKRIAREIHDELGQLLNVLRLNVTTLDFRFGETNPDLHDKAQKMVSTVDRAIQMVRNLATRLRPAVLSAGIVSALEWLVQEYAESTGIDCKLDIPSEDIPLDEDRAMVVFRIVQESLTNVLRHSGANRIDIFLRVAAGICEVEVRDNGKGFDSEHAGKRNSFGIVGMRERALILKGTLDIADLAAGGTVLKLRLPIDDGQDVGIVPEHG